MSTTAWNQEQISNFIEEFHSRRVLWDVTCTEYKNKAKKRDALKEIARVFDVTCDDVEKKIKVLKTQFRREHKALCEKKKSGCSPKKAGWFGYEPLLFLLTHARSRGSRSSTAEPEESYEESQQVNDSHPDDDLTDIDAGYSMLAVNITAGNGHPTATDTRSTSVRPSSNFRCPPPEDIKRKIQEQADDDFQIMQYIKANSTKRDEFTVFGDLVATKLRKCCSLRKSVAIAQRSIHEILFHLEMELHGVDNICKLSETAVNTVAVNICGGDFTNQPAI